MIDKQQLLSQIKEMVLQKDIVSMVDILCKHIKDCYDIDIVKSLIIILRNAIDDDITKNKIIEVLKKSFSISKDLKVKNMLLSELEILEEKVILQSIPRNITVEVSTQCNLSCLMCGFSNIENKYKYSIIDDEFVNFIKDNMSCFERITWQGGEPFLYSKIYDLISLAREKDVYQQVSTNLLVLDENKIDLLCYNKMTIFISIDGVDKKTYEQIRVGGNFDVLLRKLEIIKKYKNKNNSFRLVMAVVLLPLNYKQIDQMVKFAIDNNFDEIVFQEYMNVNNSNLYIEKDKLVEIRKKLFVYKKLYLEEKIPIIINTSVDLKNINLKDEKDIIDISNICKLKRKDINITNNPINRFISNSYSKCNYKKFCYAPWTNLCLYTDYELKITCSSLSTIYDKIDNKIWNNDFLVNYRKNILNNNLSLCVKECADKGDQGNTIRLGI